MAGRIKGEKIYLKQQPAITINANNLVLKKAKEISHICLSYGMMKCTCAHVIVWVYTHEYKITA